MVRMLILAGAFVGALTGGLWAAPPRIAGVKPTPRVMLKLERDYIAPVGTESTALKIGATVDVVTLAGKRNESLELTNIQLVKTGPAFRNLSFKSAKGQTSKFAGGQLYQVHVGEQVFDIVADPETKAFVALDLTIRNEQAEQRIREGNHQLWKVESPDDVTRALANYEELYAKAKELFPNRPFVRHETEFFIVYTDMPLNQVGGYVASLDAMYHQLCSLFGILKGTNIWLGKCPVFAFLQQEAYLQFEAEVMNTGNVEGTAGLNHGYGDGRVVITCHRGDNPTFFAVVLVHETAHGFLHRIRSSAPVPPWLNEGLSEWISAVVVPQSDHVQDRMQEAVPILRSTGSLGGNFFADRSALDRWQYGVSASVVQYLLSTDANAFRALITAIKEGYRWDEALELTYGLRPADLAVVYGRALGFPGLSP